MVRQHCSIPPFFAGSPSPRRKRERSTKRACPDRVRICEQADHQLNGATHPPLRFSKQSNDPSYIHKYHPPAHALAAVNELAIMCQWQSFQPVSWFDRTPLTLFGHLPITGTYHPCMHHHPCTSRTSGRPAQMPVVCMIESKRNTSSFRTYPAFAVPAAAERHAGQGPRQSRGPWGRRRCRGRRRR